MKKIYLLPATLFSTLFASSQVDPMATEFGIFAGPQATTANYIVNGEKQENQFKYGFQAGVTMKIPFENKLFFAPTAFYSLKGYKVSLNQFAYPPDVNAKDNNTTYHTVELAALLHYDFSSQPGHLFLKAGPSMDFHLFGKERYNLVAGGSVSRNMKFSFDGNYGYISANLLTQIGYETSSGFMIFAHYTHGLANTSNEDGGPRIRDRAYGISFGKYFNRK